MIVRLPQSAPRRWQRMLTVGRLRQGSHKVTTQHTRKLRVRQTLKGYVVPRRYEVDPQGPFIFADSDFSVITSFKQTDAEIAAGVTPTNYAYAPGIAPRYGTVGDGSTDDTTALTNWLKLGGSHPLVLPPAVYITSSQLTITLSGTDIYAYGATIKAKASTNYEKVLYASTLSNISVRGLIVDVNQANRVASLTQRSVGIQFDTVTDGLVEDCITQNAIGYTAISGFGLAFGANCVRCKPINHTSKSCGIPGKAADGIYIQGTQCTAVNPTCISCNDTGIAIESSQQSGCIGGTMLSCGAVCAITNAVAASANDNYIDGLTGYDWDASVTGGIQIGNPLASSTGDLLNTRLSNVTIHRNAGSGPAINVRQTGTAITKGLTLSNIRCKGSGTQLLLLLAQDVVIEGGDWEGTSNNAALLFQSGSARIQVKSPTIRGQFTFGIYSDGSNDVQVITPVIKGDGVNSTQGIYFANTATGCKVKLPDISGITTAQIGADAGTVPDIVWEDSLTVITYSASMTPNMILGECFVITATNGTAFTINAPTNPVNGRRLEIKLVNGSGGALGVATWNAVFKMSAWTNPANTFSRSITFRYNGTNWVQLSQTGVDVPN